MILVAYRHGLRAAELCLLRWEQIDLGRGLMHVRRIKNGTPSVHPIGGGEIRALRRLKREQPESRYVFVTERLGPMTTAGFRKLIARISEGREISVSGAPAHATACVRVQACERWARYARATALSWTQKHSAHGAVHGVISRAVQELLAGLKKLGHYVVFATLISTGEF